MFLQILGIVFELVGALALFMYGMQLTSDGIQRAAGDRLQKTVNLMTKNSFFAVVTGILVTILIQSSSATTVMVVSFVNAGLLNLFQAIGVIMGSNIGTTLTGWIIAAVGVKKFSVVALAVPIFGLGFFMSIMKKRGDAFRSYGETFMGFALIFLGLEYLAKAIPDPSPEALLFLREFAGRGWITTVACVLVGAVFTMLINASSATLAIVIGLASKDIITFQMAAAITLGANIGTTFDSFLVSLGANVNAKRAAWAHILFNVFGTLWVVVVLDPFLVLVDFITPGAITVESAGTHIAMLHTLFNTVNTIVLFPFVKQFAALVSRLIKEKPGEARKLAYQARALTESPELNVLQARKDVAELSAVAREMFAGFRSLLADEKGAMEIQRFEELENYADALKEGTTKYLLEIARQEVADKTRENISVFVRLIGELESVTDACLSLAHLADKARRKKVDFDKDEVKKLGPYTSLVEDFLAFVGDHVAGSLSADELRMAEDFENAVDGLRDELKKLARKRLKAGADVKAELLYIDVVRVVEKVGDYAYAAAVALRDIR